jgi:chromosomal replication initiation ATPase DnaA
VPARAGRLRHSELFGGSAAIEDIDHTRTKTSRRLPGAVELDALSHDDAFLSVPTKFLKSWIQSHYVDRILATLASDFPAIKRVFCHTLNALIDSRRQIVTAADRPPGDLESLDERVRSRLAGGLCIEIGALNEGLRLKILEARIAAAKLVHPTFDVPAPRRPACAAGAFWTGNKAN